MASNDHTNQLAQKLDDTCAQSIRVGALIDVFQRFNFTTVDEGNAGYAMDILAVQAESLRNMFDELAGQSRRIDVGEVRHE